MDTITKQIVEKSGGLLSIYPEVRDEGKGYTMANDGSTEFEIAEFLYAMVRVLKPKNCLESGTYKGLSSSFMAQALKDNGYGTIHTLEIEDQHIQTSIKLWQALELTQQVIYSKISSLDFTPQTTYDLFFADSEPYLRWMEVERFFPYINDGGYIFIHDVPRSLAQGNRNSDHPDYSSWPFGDLSENFKGLVREDKLRVFHFPNPRGMIGLYKVHPSDYKWL